MALFTNNAYSTLASPINNVATSISVQTGHGARFPSGNYFYVTLTQAGVESSWEIVKCTSRSGDVLTVTRAQEGTTAASWAAGDKVQLRLTAAGLSDKQDAITASGMLKGTGSAVTAATAGTDYAKPDTASSWTAAQTYSSSITETPASASTTASYTVTDRSMHFLTLAVATTTFTFPTAVAGKQFTLILAQDATGSRAVTWPTSVRWAGGTAPTLTTTASKTDVISFVCDGAYWLGFVGGFNYTRA